MDFEYFRERDGKYLSTGIPGMPGSSTVVRAAISLVPVVIIAFIYISGPGRQGFQIESLIPFAMMAAVFTFSSVISFFIRKTSFTSGVMVDQIQGTIYYRRPGARKKSVPISSIRSLGFQSSGSVTSNVSGRFGGFAVVYLINEENGKIPVAYSRKGQELRRFADELSILTSLTVDEITGEKEIGSLDTGIH